MIFYFSATGNSEWAATKLAEFTHDRLINIATSTIEKHFSYSLHAGEHIGFVFPVHGWRVPSIVREFISQLRIVNYSQSIYTYSLVTCGDSTGETMSILQKLLLEIGLHLNASFSLIMPESYIGLPFMYLDNKESEQRKYAKSNVRLQRFAEMICESRGGEQLDKGTFPNFYSGFLGGFFSKYIVTDKYFHVDKKKCIGCSICSKICPVNDIRCDKGKNPEWMHNNKCLTCFACLHHCPTNAISWGWFTKGKGQYFFHNKK